MRRFAMKINRSRRRSRIFVSILHGEKNTIKHSKDVYSVANDDGAGDAVNIATKNMKK